MDLNAVHLLIKVAESRSFTQAATLLGAGFTPVILVSLQAAANGSTFLVGLYMIGLAVVSAVFIALSKESKDRDLDTYEH